MNQNKYIVSLTTIPAKFDNLYLTVDSIINQTILPDKIIINIPKIYNEAYQAIENYVFPEATSSNLIFLKNKFLMIQVIQFVLSSLNLKIKIIIIN
jgi:hypothetical protein